jgi:hypothetical protein
VVVVVVVESLVLHPKAILPLITTTNNNYTPNSLINGDQSHQMLSDTATTMTTTYRWVVDAMIDAWCQNHAI